MNMRLVFRWVLLLLPIVISSFSAEPQIGLSFTGSTFGVDSSSLPSDTDGAIGPNHYVELLNGRFAVYDKNTGKRLMSKTDISFWTNAGVTLGRSLTVTDPRVVYDPDSGRWFASMVDLNIRRQNANRFLLAVSSSSDPTEAWHALAFSAAGGLNDFADFPTMGFDTDTVYLSGDLFNSFGNPVGPIVMAIPKSSLLTIPPTTDGKFSSGLMSYSSRGDILQPAMLTGTASTPEVLVAVGDVGEDFAPHSTIVLTPIQKTGGTISLGSSVVLTVPSYEIPINPAQPGNTDTLDDGDARISASARRVGDIIYAAHCIEVSNRAVVRWYRIDAANLALIESGTITDPELELFYPSIAANSNGTVVIGCNGTSSSTYISAFAFVGHIANNVLTFGDRMLLKAGLATYDTHDSSGVSRWGDYSATTVDPNDPTHFWTSQSFPRDSTTWATQITEIVVASPSTNPIGTAPLTIAGTDGGLQISWPSSAGTVLQYTASLTNPDWKPYPGNTSDSNGQTSVTVSPSDQAAFFRVVQSAALPGIASL